MNYHVLETLKATDINALTEMSKNSTDDDVRRALSIDGFTPERLAHLISPAAEKFLEEMATSAHELTVQRFGKTISLYAPLYVSSFCINRCAYCGFHAGLDIPSRRRLSVDEAVAEAEVISREGFGDILLVSGEDPKNVSVDYFCELAKKLRGMFSSIAIEIYPLEKSDYEKLRAAGVDGVTLYQETYEPQTYKKYHESGPKSDYEMRLKFQEQAAAAQMFRLGIGSLLGLNDWRYETISLALHASTLMKYYWQSKVAVSFPRLRPMGKDMPPVPHPVTDTNLVQMILALRLCFTDMSLVLSTRESESFRNSLLPLGITQMSAGSKTSPGAHTMDHSTEQFSIADARPAKEVAEYLQSQGYEPVWKDFDSAFTTG